MELLLANPNLMNRVMYDAMYDMDRVEKSIFPYWRNADHSVLHVANDTVKAVDDDKKSFTRKWLLPENVDLEAVRTQVDNKGHLSVEAPKHMKDHPKRRIIPITAAPPASSAPAKK
ncbi:hypothetical protein TELCIR_22042 [Teladorsagia circumcincta]|uniref:SHSP domain-containing protein n=1 Tax=Teladorsagia circumcincta TaxID=45464 RepID=A0A2G9TF93_TELCI|nr:hypothetical protein TELCIR_22042 [Teladorsagia circumcincta]